MASRKNLLRFLVLVAALAAFFGAARFSVRIISNGPLRTLIEANLTQALGLAVSLDELFVALLPTPHLHAEGVRVDNGPGRSAPHLLRIDRLDLGFEFWPLLERIVVVNRIEIEGADLHVEKNAKGRLPGGLELVALVHDGDLDPLQLELRELRIETLRVFYGGGQDEEAYSLILDSAALESEELGSEISLEVQGQFESSPLLLSGRIGSLHQLLNRTQPFPVNLHARFFGADLEATGTVREPWTLDGLELEISGEIPRLIVQDHPLPQLGAIRFGGHLSDLDGSLGLEDFRLDSTKTVPVRLAVHGTVDDLLGLKEVDVEFNAESLSLDFLKPLLQSHVEFAVPTIASASAEFKLSNQNGHLDLEGTVDAVTSGESIVMHAEGGIRDLTGLAELDLKIDARAEDLASVTSLIPEFAAHGEFGPVTASSRLKRHKGVLAADQIEIRLGSRKHAWAELDGSVADLVRFRDVELELAFGAQSLHHLKEVLRRELPRTSLLEGSAAINDKDGSLGFEHLRLHGGENSPIEIHLEARFDDLPRRGEIDIELAISAQDTRTLGAIAGLDLEPIAPMEFHGKVKGSEQSIEVENMTLQLGETRLLGNLSGSFPPNLRPSIEARLTSSHVRMQDLELIRSESASGLPTSNGPRKTKVPIALPFDRLHQIDLDLGLRFDRVVGYWGFDGSDVGFMLRLHDGDLVVTDVGANYQGGKLSAEMRVDARTPIPRLEARLQTKALNIARVMSQFDKDTEFSGILDTELELQATGSTLESLRQSLTGNVRARMRDGNAASKISREFVVNLSEAVFPGFLTRKVPAIGCAMLDLEIEHGIANVRTLRLQGKETAVSGTGEVDLIRGLYDLHVVPETTNPKILSISPEVYVDGPLDDPQFHPKKATLLTSFGSGLLRNAVKAGASLLRPFGIRSDDSNFAEECRPASPEPG